MSSRKIASIINEKLKNDNITISKDIVNRYLNSVFGRPRKIREVFHLTNSQKKKRIEFCEKMLDLDISGNKLFLQMKLKLRQVHS